jgi:hypothetical protein
MKLEKRIVRTLAAFALICGFSIAAHAQLGSGWTPDNETYTPQTSSGCTITAISGGFEFSTPSGSGRAEERGNNLPTNTTNQWQGFATLKSFPSGSDNICMHQVFGPAPSTPDLILDERHVTGGTGIEIMSLEQGDAFEAYISVGVQFQMNTIYDPVGNIIRIYVNGSQTGTKTPNSGVHYNKFGQYVSLSGSGPSTMDWVNVQSWAGGSAGGGGPTSFTITASASSGGSISPSGGVVVNKGANQTFTITPNAGFSVSSVTVDGANQGAITSYTFSNVQANHTISAAFSSTTTNFTITASAGSGGSISPSGGVVVAKGANQSFSITANSGFSVSSVTVDGANQGAITSYTFSNVQANHTISAAFQSSGGGCVTASVGGSWQDAAMSSSQSGSFTATFDSTPSASPNNAVVGLSNGAQTAYTGFACLVRFNTSGNIDARNGGAYAAASTIPFSAGTSYHFRLAVNVTAHTYSIFVTPAGGSELTVGSNYAFRTEQNTVTSLNYWGTFVDAASSGGAGSVTTCNFSVTGGGGGSRTLTGSSGDGWHSLAISPGATGTFTATYDATPSASPENAVIGLSNGAATAFGNLGCIARFNPSGQIDAYNGTAYAAASSINYSAGVSYHFEMDVNLSAHTYSVYVTPAGGSKTLVGSNYAFRSTANTMTSLTDWNLYVDPSNAGSLTANNLSP